MRYSKNLTAQLDAFFALAATGKIEDAARKLNRTPSAIAQRIAVLRRSLAGKAGPPGPKLFERRKGRLVLTQYGMLLRQMTEAARRDLAHLPARFASASSQFGTRVSVSVAAGESTLMNLLPKRIEAFFDKNTNVEMTLNNTKDGVGLEMLAAGTVELVVGPRPEPGTPGFSMKLHFEPIQTYGYVAIAPKGHPLSLCNPFGLELLLNGPLILPPREGRTFQLVSDALRKKGLDCLPRILTGGYLLLKVYVEAGQGAAVVSEVCLSAADRERLWVSPPIAELGTRTYGLITRGGQVLRPTARRLRNALLNPPS